MTDINKLKTLQELKGKIKSLFTDVDILRLVKDKMMPHYVLKNPATDEETILFDAGELNKWLVETCLTKHTESFCQNLTILHFDYEYHKISKEDNVPVELSKMKDLYKLPMAPLNSPPGIYFLCKGKEVVYKRLCTLGKQFMFRQGLSSILTKGKRTSIRLISYLAI
jgi:hypothetical protein